MSEAKAGKRSPKELGLRYGIFLIGLFINSLGVSLITKANLGTSPISSIPYVLSLEFPWSMGVFTILFNVLLVLFQLILLRKKFKPEYWLQIPVAILFGWFIDLTMMLLGWMNPQGYLLEAVSLLIGCAVLGFGVYLEVLADVVMLLNLFPHMVPEELVRKNVLFYEARTIHDSSLSYCAHAQACAAIGAMDLAEDFFEKSLVIDLDDNPYDTTDGVHSASLGGVWNCLVFGFAGVHYEGEILYLQPHMPAHWKSMEFQLRIAGQTVHFQITGQKVRLSCEETLEIPIHVKIEDQEYSFTGEMEISVGETLCA